MLGVATLIIVMAVMNGFRSELLDKILGINGHVVVQPIDAPLTDYADVAAARQVNGVTAAIPLVEGRRWRRRRTTRRRARARRPRAGLCTACPASRRTSGRHARRFRRGEGVAIGRRLADHARPDAGDNLTLVSPRGAVTPMGMTPRFKAYPVAAIFEIGMSEYDAPSSSCRSPRRRPIFNRRTTCLASRSISTIPTRRTRRERRAGGRPRRSCCRLAPAQQTFFSRCEVERNVMFMILTLIVLVAALNIISGLIMLVKDKGPTSPSCAPWARRGLDPAHLPHHRGGDRRRRHARRRAARHARLHEHRVDPAVRVLDDRAPKCSRRSSIFCRSCRPISNPGETRSIVIMALVLSYLATLYPAWRAARLDPVEALRYE
ncbi:MAG: ABC transporter permease [Candidatus Kaistia colombiensis]|nr:MAG: ABC transporter permease [Kaistia sp.]